MPLESESRATLLAKETLHAYCDFAAADLRFL
jgi:hypothetical protein